MAEIFWDKDVFFPTQLPESEGEINTEYFSREKKRDGEVWV